MRFSYGFTYKGVRFGWSDKKLYRLPYESKNKNHYGLKEVKPIMVGDLVGYRCMRDKLTINRVKDLTRPVDWKVEVVQEVSDCPF